MPYTNHQELIARIEAAFPDRQYQLDRLACDCDCLECLRLDKTLRSKRWSEFTPKQTRYISSGTSLYTDEAFTYILPAYLRACLINLKQADTLVDSVAWSFIPYEAYQSLHRNLALFNKAQREVIVDWLEWWVLSEEDEWKDLLAETPDNDVDRNELREEQRELITRYRQKLGEWQKLVYG